MDTLEHIRQQVRADNYEFSFHAERERENEHILVAEIEQSVASGEMLEDYQRIRGRERETVMKCGFCDGELEERLVQHEYRWEGKLFVFEDVPARVCRQCGEKHFDATVVKAMERAVLGQMRPKCVLEVPIYIYADVAAA